VSAVRWIALLLVALSLLVILLRRKK